MTTKPSRRSRNATRLSSNYGKFDPLYEVGLTDGSRFPRSVLNIKSDPEFFRSNKSGYTIHPTQKPVSLFEYLIKTYTTEGDTVLDNVIGSGTTAVSAFRTGRKWIGIEKDNKIFEMCQQRIKRDTMQQVLITV